MYVLIAFEFLHRTLAALLGAASLLTVSYTLGTFRDSFRILTFEDAIGAIDMNVIFLQTEKTDTPHGKILIHLHSTAQNHLSSS